MTTVTRSRTKMRTITVEVPEELAVAVEARGGHIPGLVERALSEWIPDHNDWAGVWERLHDVEPVITAQEIEEEVALWKRERAEARERANRR